MSCEGYDVGSRVEAVSDFSVQENLIPGQATTHEVKSGDTGGVAGKQTVGNTHWLRIRWDRLNRVLNLDGSQMELIKPEA
jgi:hypothetical protein